MTHKPSIRPRKSNAYKWLIVTLFTILALGIALLVAGIISGVPPYVPLVVYT